jgi:hypothetical protein
MRAMMLVCVVLVLGGFAGPSISQSGDVEYRDEVQKMYIAYYGRPGDPGGISFWAGKLESGGGDLAGIIDAFGSSAEYEDRFSSLSSEALVNNIYRQLLGRDADAAGLAFYAARLDSGEFTLASIALNIADGIGTGDADADTYANKLEVANAFTDAVALTGADYGAEEIAATVELLAAVDEGSDIDQALAAVDALINDILDVDTGPVDITNAIFQETSGDCALYAALYEASVLDIQRSLGFQADLEISAGDNSCALISNSIPNHDFNDQGASFATPTSEVSQSFTIPRLPARAAQNTALSQMAYNAIMLNGVPLDLISAGCYKPDDPMADPDGNVPIGCRLEDGWILDPLGTDNGFGTDSHNAHTQPNGLYHYHGNPHAMFDDNPGPNGSPVIGFAADGFPVYGSYFYDSDSGTVRKARSGFTLRNGIRDGGPLAPGGAYDGTYRDDWEWTDNGDLDECNGMTVDGQYGYYVTDTYPWVMACLAGVPDTSFRK